jgi:hypothetical protein
VSTPRVTARPAATPVPGPTTAPTPSPAPTATATPTTAPTSSPPILCTVANLVGVNTGNAQLTWSTAGFTGTVLYSPAIPPQYKIGWQSLTPGESVPCTSDITVQQLAP